MRAAAAAGAAVVRRLLTDVRVQHGRVAPQRARERGLSMDSGGGYGALVVIIAIVLVASMFV
jgi:hypothetical protein